VREREWDKHSGKINAEEQKRFAENVWKVIVDLRASIYPDRMQRVSG